MEIRVFIYDVKEDYTRQKLYTARDITSSVLQPISEVERTDTALDTCNITILNKDENPIKPFTRFRIEYTQVENNVEQKDTTFWLVDNDSVELAKYNVDPTKRAYQHKVSLIEPTKWLERFDVDNTTITNMLMFLYQDAGVPSGESAYSMETGGLPHIIAPNYSSNLSSVQYANTERYLAITSNTTRDINCGCRMLPVVRFYAMGIFHSDVAATLTSYRVKKPDGTYDTLTSATTTYNAPTDGKYTFEQVYEASKWGMNWTITFTWETSYKELSTYTEKLPTRFNMAEVVDRVLSKVTRENSICLENETPLFQLDPEQRDLLATMIAPEFTFTQSTLFDIMMQIGIAMHAIPRLVIADAEEEGTMWNTIHFDFLGKETEANNPLYPQVSYEKTQRSDNFATAFVSNVQNAFVSSNTEYITITEPFSGGYISARTEASDFEISKDSNCIKTSRPIQRITELWVRFGNLEYDIAPYCLERADYNLLTDAQYQSVSSLWGLGTKETNIYYTRGDNVIRGLDYIAPDSISIAPSYGKKHTIKNILILLLQTRESLTPEQAAALVGLTNECDYGYRIKYVPYMNMKVKQFRDVIEDEMETSTLFFNQNGQQVDINAFGERIKAALNMTSNQEPTMTFVSKNRKTFKMGGLTVNIGGKIGQYIPYEIRREITAKCTTTSIIYSKDFNKWNEYDAIKKNYREWEISENECVEQNPIYNQFCLISDDLDYMAIMEHFDEMTIAEKEIVKESLRSYAHELNAKEGFIGASADIIESIYAQQSNDISIEWMIAQVYSKEWHEETGEYYQHRTTFMIPTTAVAIGNAIVLNVGTKDNYSAGTTTEKGASQSNGYRMEVDIQYGSKYGNAEYMRLKLGHGQFDANANMNTQPMNLYSVTSGKAESAVGTIKMWNNRLKIDKDSRQQINLTMQLNFISEKDYIWISSRLPVISGLTGKKNRGLKIAYFNKTPSRFFNSEYDYEIIENQVPIGVVPMIIDSYDDDPDPVREITPTYMVQFNYLHVPSKDYVGWGLLDTENNLVLYYNKPIQKNVIPKSVYFQFRDRI